MAPNNSFKPNLLRYTKAMAERACHGFGSTTQVGLTQALGAMRTFRAVTTLLAVALLVSALLHLVLLASDSPDYRSWVYLQMALQLVGAGLLWYVRKFKLGALLAFAVVSAFGIYVNAVHLNYGNGPLLWLAPLLFWCLYGSLAVVARKQFVLQGAGHGT